MLVLTRQEGESLKIGEDITITVTKVRDEQVQVGITAPPEVSMLRLPSHLQLSPHNIFYFRRSVPDDLPLMHTELNYPRSSRFFC